MRPHLAFMSFVLVVVVVSRAQAGQEIKVPDCTPAQRESGSMPVGPYKILPNESFKHSPVVKFQINTDGTVSDVKIVRGSGIRDINRKVLESVSKWKYKPNTECGVVEVKMTVIIEWH